MDQVSALYNLQEIDSEILTCLHRLENPQNAAQLTEVKNRLAKMASQIKLCLAQKDELKASLDQSDAEIQSCKDRIDEITRVSSTSTDHRFLLEARDEISLLEKRIDKLLHQATPVREKLSHYTKVIEASATKMQGEHQHYQELQKEAAKVQQELKNQLEALKIERDEEARRLDEEIYDRYESSRIKHHGIGLARLTEDGSCSACKMSFPEGIVLRLKRAHIFTECPNCHRFMIVEEAIDA